MEVVRFPEVYTFCWEFIKILSISVEDVPIIVGRLIWGVKLFEKIDSRNFIGSNIFSVYNLKDWR